MLAGVKPYVSAADLAICHLETPLAKASGPFSGYPSFSGPPQVAPALKAVGYDACSTASNHTFDQGADGIKRTLDGLDAAGLAHAGSARTRSESRRITLLRANGVRVAFLSYAYGWNGNGYPGGDRWRANVIDRARILADAQRARAAGAQIVVLAMHWGTEYRQEPSAQQRDLAPDLARSGLIDVIISHHAHVVEPIQRIGTTWVTYGLGNLLADHSTPGSANAEGLLARFTFTRGSTGRFTATAAEYVPLMMTKTAPLRVLDVRRALRTGDYGSSTRPRLRAALARTTRVVQSLDGAKNGLRDAGVTPASR
jgi:poly-gamma-glutamate synthesis protein (capsule biosynthesis protein)